MKNTEPKKISTTPETQHSDKNQANDLIDKNRKPRAAPPPPGPKPIRKDQNQTNITSQDTLKNENQSVNNEITEIKVQLRSPKIQEKEIKQEIQHRESKLLPPKDQNQVNELTKAFSRLQHAHSPVQTVVQENGFQINNSETKINPKFSSTPLIQEEYDNDIESFFESNKNFSGVPNLINKAHVKNNIFKRHSHNNSSS